MDGTEIITKLTERLDYHLKTASNFQQEPYKSDIFKLFVEVYKGDHFVVSAHPRLTGDAIHVRLTNEWPGAKSQQGQNLLLDVVRVWDEWK
jgi:hypothetical protein